MNRPSYLIFIITLTNALLLLCSHAQSVTPDKVSYVEGEEIIASYSGGPGNASDWIAIYSQGNIPDGSPAASAWYYTNGTQTAGGSSTAGDVTFTNSGLVAGNYSVWFLANDGYTAIAGPTNFTITEPPVTDPPSWLVSQFKRRHGVSGAAYTGKISAYTNFSSYDFSKVTGPAWLTVSNTGILSGTPAMSDVGMNTFTVRASNGTVNADATMTIEVFAPNTEIVRGLKMMSYNAWHGWGQINNGHRKGLESIILSGADIIGMQESTDNVSGSGVYQPQKIASDLGWFYRSNISGSLGLFSRYPITDQTLAAGIARGIKVKLTESPQQEVILMNCHLDYTDYGPYAAQISGATEASVLAEETTSDRDEQITAIMNGMSAILNNADSIPVFLTGDFNAPSHLDWVPATAAAHGGVESVAWPTSTAVINAGMKDSYRMIHTNPAAMPGNTWSPTFKGTEPQDRIDFIYYKGSSLKPVASLVYTTAVENTVGAWGSSITPLKNNTWPSDHAAVVTTLKLKPVDADADGLSDAFENKYFGNTTAQIGSGDEDQDGSSNQMEQALGTDPTDKTSFPATILTIPDVPLTAPEISFELSELALENGLVCERSNNLQTWDTVWSYQADPSFSASVISVTESAINQWNAKITDTGVDSTLIGKIFYRVRLGN